MVNRHDAGRQLRLSLALLLLTVCPAVAAAVEEDDPTRPVGSFDLRPKYEDDTVTAPNDKGSLTFRGNFTWALGGDWKLAAREDLPLVLSGHHHSQCRRRLAFRPGPAAGIHLCRRHAGRTLGFRHRQPIGHARIGQRLRQRQLGPGAHNRGAGDVAGNFAGQLFRAAAAL